MNKRVTYNNTANFRSQSTPRKYHQSYYEEPTRYQGDKYSLLSQPHPNKSLRRWYDDCKEKQFQGLNQYDNIGVSKARKLLDNHSHAFDFIMRQEYVPNKINIIIDSQDNLPKTRNKSTYNTQNVQIQVGNYQNNSQERIRNQQSEQLKDVGIQTHQIKISNRKQKCKCTRCKH